MKSTSWQKSFCCWQKVQALQWTLFVCWYSSVFLHQWTAAALALTSLVCNTRNMLAVCWLIYFHEFAYTILFASKTGNFCSWNAVKSWKLKSTGRLKKWCTVSLSFACRCHLSPYVNDNYLLYVPSSLGFSVPILECISLSEYWTGLWFYFVCDSMNCAVYIDFCTFARCSLFARINRAFSLHCSINRDVLNSRPCSGSIVFDSFS